jgi:hypothetical protein
LLRQVDGQVHGSLSSGNPITISGNGTRYRPA